MWRGKRTMACDQSTRRPSFVGCRHSRCRVKARLKCRGAAVWGENSDSDKATSTKYATLVSRARAAVRPPTFQSYICHTMTSVHFVRKVTVLGCRAACSNASMPHEISRDPKNRKSLIYSPFQFQPPAIAPKGRSPGSGQLTPRSPSRP